MEEAMKKSVLRIIALFTLLGSLGTVLPISASAAGYDNTFEVDINGFDCKTDGGSVFVYPNNTDSIRRIMANDFGFRYTKLMVFDKDGFLIEAGGEIYENSATVTGAPQISVSVPAGGFLVAFKTNVSKLFTAFNTAMEGAMLYNATMSVIYEVKGSVNGSKLKIEYDNPSPDATDAKKFMFIGNSSTYFNGTPIKFKGLATAAGVKIDVDYCTFGSAFLSEFADANHERGKTMRNKLKDFKYDYVVLQDASSANYYTSKPAIDTILPLIKANGAEALLYMRYSAASTFEQNVKNAKRHYDNYTQLAETFGLNCAPAASAFIISIDKYPDINLYADDGGHHSKEGSYLIACVWLYSYLGVDPVGNSYTAQLDAEVARKLQECAKEAVEKGYPYPDSGTSDVYTDDEGTTYQNIAIGKKYTVTGTPYNGNWTDTDNNAPLGKLTDGKYAPDGDDQLVGAYGGKNGHSVTIDLGQTTFLRSFKTDLFGNESWGIPSPAGTDITVSFSYDGENFFDIGKMAKTNPAGEGNWIKSVYTITPENAINARYVRLTYTNAAFIWASEISVYGKVFEDEDPEAPTESTPAESDPVGDNQSGKGNNAWLYWLLGGIALAGAAAAAILISKKKK